MPIYTADGQEFQDRFDQALNDLGVKQEKASNVGIDSYHNASNTNSDLSEILGAGPTPSAENVDKFISAVGGAVHKEFIAPVTNFIQHVGDVYQGKADPGDIKPVVDFASALGEGGLPLSSFKPGLGMFGGRMTKTAVNAAERMEAQGLSNYSIKEMTGLERGADGMWRREFSDVNAVYNPKGYSEHPEGGYPVADLKDVLDHPEFYKAYPEAGLDVAVTTVPKINGEERTLGMYHPQLDMIFLKEGMSDQETKSVLIHELQHYIQNKEGFSYGSPATLPDDVKDQYKGYLIRKYMGQHVDQVVNELEQGAHDEAERLAHNILVSADYNLYKNQAVEVEARNAQARMQMSPRQIKNTLAIDTEDVPRGEQIVQQGRKIRFGSPY